MLKKSWNEGTNRQTDRQTDRQIDRYRWTGKIVFMDGWSDRQIVRQTNCQTDRLSDRQMFRQTDGRTDRQMVIWTA